MAKRIIIFNEQEIKDICYKYRFGNLLETDIAALYNVSRKTIKKCLNENNCIRAYKDKEWLEEQYLKNKLNKREIANIANCSEFSIAKSFKLFNIKTDDNISRKRKYSYNETFFDNIDNSEKAYWLGFISADGCIINNTNNETSNIRLDITLSIIDIEHLKKLSNILCPGIKISTRKTYLKTTDKWYEQCRVRFYSKYIVESLIKLGIYERKSLKEVYPNIPEEFDKDFIRGQFDGDGCFTILNNNKAQLTLIGGENMTKTLNEKIFKHLGIKANIRKQKKLSIITYNGTNAECIMNWLYSNNEVHLSRKYDKFNNYLSNKI